MWHRVLPRGQFLTGAVWISIAGSTFFLPLSFSAAKAPEPTAGRFYGAHGKAVLEPHSGVHRSVGDTVGGDTLGPGEAVGAVDEKTASWAIAAAPTRSSFLLTWDDPPTARGYLLDVSLSPSFVPCLPGYSHLELDSPRAIVVSRLQPSTRYYYRLQAYDGSGITREVIRGTTSTAAPGGLTINPTFDKSITNNPNAAQIEAMIMQAVALYESLFNDPVTVEIRFRYATTDPDGSPIPATDLARSVWVYYDISWNTYVTSLNADARSAADGTGDATLPPVPLIQNVAVSSANGRAVGIETPPALFADGTVGVGGPYDGIVTLNSASQFDFTRPIIPTQFDALRLTQHEINEVLGFGSHLDLDSEPTALRPQDLFSWSSPGVRNTASSGARYLSLDSGTTSIVSFNQDPNGDFGDWSSGNCPQIHPYVQNAFACAGQSSDVAATSPEGTNLDIVGYNPGAPTPTPAPVPASLGNISTRLGVETGDQVLIGGFIIDGTQPKDVIVRALGPSLPLSGTLADPILELHLADGSVMSNDNWRSDQEAEIMATGFAPAFDLESAIVLTLNPGAYTAIVKGAHGETGVGLVEVYDLDQSSDSELANISTRGLVQTGDNVLIGGFIVLGNQLSYTLVRAIGPSLPVSGSLADPMLELHDAQGRAVVSNDDWRSNQEDEIIPTGFAPDDDAESAIVAILAPGSYTAIVRGKNDTTGVALVEVYKLF
ncbi:MAG TPA: NF038122 family metalloprotease [Chthoniobacterales bacterium]|nr:NF038122 family metalloprotease [Chthoniobacterales bacterium]